MDTVILAAGKGSRLAGIMPPYHKPLMIVDGQPLIVSAANRAWVATGGRVIIVAAPENVLPISQVMREAAMGVDYRITVQVNASGPGDALLYGCELVRSQNVLVLLGDNVSTYADMQKVAHTAGNAVGTHGMKRELAGRFTRRRQDGTWVEKVPVNEQDVDPTTGDVLVWVGPIKMETAALCQALTTARLDQRSERPIGPAFNDLEPIALVPVSSIDIGLPDTVVSL